MSKGVSVENYPAIPEATGGDIIGVMKKQAMRFSATFEVRAPLPPSAVVTTCPHHICRTPNPRPYPLCTFDCMITPAIHSLTLSHSVFSPLSILHFLHF